MDAQRTAETLARNLEALDQVISAHEFRNELQSAPNNGQLEAHYAAAEELRRHHEESLHKLSSLAADVGLLQAPLPNRQLLGEEQEYLKLLVMARGIKTTLWTKISRYHDEMNPLRESRRRGGGGLIGKLGLY